MPSVRVFRFASPVLVLALLVAASPTRAQTRDQWIEWSTRVSGGFSIWIPIGIRVGLDAQKRLDAGTSDLAVTYYTGARAPCACIADGVMISAHVSPGQGTLEIAGEEAPPGFIAVIVVRNRKTGAAARYSISNSWTPKLTEWDRMANAAARYESVMAAEDLFQVSPMRSDR